MQLSETKTLHDELKLPRIAARQPGFQLSETMKNRLNPMPVVCVALCLLFSFLANHAGAAVDYWDPQAANTQNPYLGSMTGTWESSKWSTSGSGQASSIAGGEGNAACFGVNAGKNPPAYTVTMNGNHTVAGIFDGPLAPNSSTVTITGSGIMTLPSGQQGFDLINASEGSLAFVTINNVIAGSGNITPEGNGQLFLNGVNTYTGGTTLDFSGNTWGGLINFNNSASFGASSGPITMTSFGSGSALVAEGSSAIAIPNPCTTTASYNLNIVGNAAGVTLSGAWTLGTFSSTNGAGGSGNLVTISGVISGSGTFTKYNPSTLALSGVNTFTGPLTITSGPLTISGAGQVGSGTYAGNIANSTGGTFNYSSTASQILSGAFSGATGTFNVNGPGTLTLSGGADNNSLGATINNGGKLVLAKTSTSGVHALGAATTVNNGGTLQLGGSGGDQIFDGVTITVTSGGVFDLNSKSETMTGLNLSGTGISSGGALINSTTTATSTLTCSGGITLAANSSIGGSGNITLASAIGGSGKALAKGGTGTLALNAANSYGGAPNH